MKLTARRAFEALVILAYVIALVWSLTSCDPSTTDNDGVGHKGWVTNRLTKGSGANRTYYITIKDETKGTITFRVRKGWYDSCSPKKYYPGCRVKI